MKLENITTTYTYSTQLPDIIKGDLKVLRPSYKMIIESTKIVQFGGGIRDCWENEYIKAEVFFINNISNNELCFKINSEDYFLEKRERPQVHDIERYLRDKVLELDKKLVEVIEEEKIIDNTIKEEDVLEIRELSENTNFKEIDELLWQSKYGLR